MERSDRIMEGDYGTLEITLTSAKDLKNVNIFSKLETYAVVSLSSDPQTRKRTPTDRENGRNPKWNAPMKFQIPASSINQLLNLDIYIRAERALGDRIVGKVHVPIKDFVSEARDPNRVRYMSYQVRRPSGRPKGVINFEYKFDGASVPQLPPPLIVDEPVTAYPVGYFPPPPPSNAHQKMNAPYAYPPPPVENPLHGYGGGGGGGYSSYVPTQQPPAVYHQSGYGYGYGGGYSGGVRPQKPPKKNKFGLGLGAGLLGGLLVGDALGDAGGFDCDF